MFDDIETLLYRRHRLHCRKVAVLQDLKTRKAFLDITKALNKAHLLVTREILVNRQLLKIFKLRTFPHEMKLFVGSIRKHLTKVNRILAQEHQLLCQANMVTHAYSTLQKKMTRRKGYFEKQLRKLHLLATKEQALNETFFNITKKLPKEFQIKVQELNKAIRLTHRLEKEIRLLAQSIGNTRLVQAHGKHALRIIQQLQKTELYEFVNQDVSYVRKKVLYVMQHPKEHKIAYILTTIYIIAPLTFEATGAILFFRYLGKYTLSQTKRLRKKITFRKPRKNQPRL